MWVFTQHGFYSVVAFEPKKDKSGEAKRLGVRSSRSHVLMRARIREDLEDVRDTYLADLVIGEDKSADYSFRAVLRREDYTWWLSQQSEELDYDSHFKEAARAGSKGAAGRYAAYMSVWSTLANLQKSAPYGAFAGGGHGFLPTLHSRKDVAWTAPLPVILPETLPALAVHEETAELLDVAWVREELTRRVTDDFTMSMVYRMSDSARELYDYVDEFFSVSDQPITERDVADVISTLSGREEAKNDAGE